MTARKEVSFKLFSKNDFIDMGIALGDVYLLMEEMNSRLKLQNANDLKSLLASRERIT